MHGQKQNSQEICACFQLPAHSVRELVISNGEARDHPSLAEAPREIQLESMSAVRSQWRVATGHAAATKPSPRIAPLAIWTEEQPHITVVRRAEVESAFRDVEPKVGVVIPHRLHCLWREKGRLEIDARRSRGENPSEASRSADDGKCVEVMRGLIEVDFGIVV